MTSVIVFGDSNLKHIYVKDVFDKKLGVDTSFVQTNTKEIFGITLDKAPKKGRKLVFHSSWLNEISSRCRALEEEDKAEERDEECEKTIENIMATIVEAIDKKPDWFFLIMLPLRRKNPVWIDQNLPSINEKITQNFEELGRKNIKLISAPEIEDGLFGVDGIHLNTKGKGILQAHILDSIKSQNAKPESETEIDWSDIESAGTSKKASKASRKSQQITQSGVKTRAKRLRSRVESEESGDENEAKKPNLDLRGLESILKQSMDRMEAMVNKVTGQTEQNTKDIAEVRDETKEKFRQLDLTLARLKEETDTADNERMRDTVIIKKMVTEATIPKTPHDLNTLIKKEANEMVKNLLKKEDLIRYIGLAFPVNNATKKSGSGSGSQQSQRSEQSQINDLPPIKIQFKKRDDCVEFRYKAIEESKKYNARYSGVYLVHPQNPATRVRVMIMWAMAKNLKNEKEKVDAWVNQASPKPTLIVKKAKAQKVYTFVQAVVTFGHIVKNDELTQPTTLANRFFKTEVSKLFIILKDEEN